MPEGKTKIRVKIRSGRGAQSTPRARSQAQPPRGSRQVPRRPLRRFPGQALLLGLASIVVVIGGVAWLFFPARDHEAELSQAVDTPTDRSSPESGPARQEQRTQFALRSPSPASSTAERQSERSQDKQTSIGYPERLVNSPQQVKLTPPPASPRQGTNEPIAMTGSTAPDPRPVETQEAQQKHTPPERDIQDAGASAGQSYSKHVARAQFTNGIEEREPTDRIGPVVYPNGEHVRRLYFFTELKDLKGERVTHRWEHEGETMAKVSFPVRGNRWRVYSSKHLTAAMTGDWRVVVVDSAGEPLQVSHFSYTSDRATTAGMD